MTERTLGNTFNEDEFRVEIIISGHGLDTEVVRAELLDEIGRADELGMIVGAEERYWRTTGRMKWCENVLGWGCDNAGEWHRHWVGVQPHPDYAVTIAWWAEPTANHEVSG